MAKRILVVDDEPDILQVTSFRLKKAGYEVLTAIDGREAMDLIKKEPLDLILLDLVLPQVTGYEVCKWVKADDKLKEIPVILFTASAVHDVTEKASQTGAQDYIVKPFEPEELLAKVKKFIK